MRIIRNISKGEEDTGDGGSRRRRLINRQITKRSQRRITNGVRCARELLAVMRMSSSCLPVCPAEHCVRGSKPDDVDQVNAGENESMHHGQSLCYTGEGGIPAMCSRVPRRGHLSAGGVIGDRSAGNWLG